MKSASSALTVQDPVGFFDSGVGGTCILKAFVKLCPEAKTIYLADSRHCPYGNRTSEEIIRLAEANVKKLLRRRCRVIVIACNTATAAAIDYLRKKYSEVPFVGLEPAVKPAALKSKSGVIGVLATAGTFNGRLYNETKARFAKSVTVIASVADEFVSIVESAVIPGTVEIDAQKLSTPSVERVVRTKIEPLIKAGADHIVLGCTHFPHLKPIIERVVAGRAAVLDPSEAVAKQVARMWKLHLKRKMAI